MFVRLHEREHGLAVVREAVDAAASGRGAAVVLEGAAGIGKTSMLERVCEAARDRGLAAAVARGSELEESYAWGVVRQLFEPRLRGMSAGARGRALAGAAALAGPVVLPDDSADPEPSFGVLHGLYWLVAALAEQRPQLLVVDDLHWSDGASARFLEFLANRLDALPVLLLAGARTGGTLRAAALVTSIRLAPLSPAATGAVLAERDGGPVSEAFVRACHDATGGNPLLIRRLADGVKHWVESSGVDPFGDLPGYRGSMTLVDRNNARLVGIGFYASAGQAKEADSILSTMPDRVRAELPEEIRPALDMRPESIGLYEIVHRD